MRNRFKILMPFLFCGIAFTSCKDDDKDPDPVYEQLKLSASIAIIEPFQNIELSVDMSVEDMKANYDSVLWIADGHNSKPATISTSESSDISYNAFQKSLTITQVASGEHTAYVRAYKDERVVSESSVKYNVVKPTHDFFAFDWTDDIDKTYEFTSRQLLSKSDYGLTLKLKKYLGEHPFMLLSADSWSPRSGVESERDLYTDEMRAQVGNIYRKLITDIYGASLFHIKEDASDLSALETEYKARFKSSLSYLFRIGYQSGGIKGAPESKGIIIDPSYPIEIWETDKNYISLILKKDCILEAEEFVYRNWYGVIVEPRVQD